MNVKEFSVSEKNRKELLKTARQAIASYLKAHKLVHFESDDPELTAPAAVFVTLTEAGELRGCIGTVVPEHPLIQAVGELAVAAAVDDPRFPPVTGQELDNIRIEISVLSPMTRVKSAAEIRQNVHGVMVRRNGRSGLFLPQVWEHFSSKEAFLNELCYQKAGIQPTAWREPETELYVFTVFAFEEH